MTRKLRPIVGIAVAAVAYYGTGKLGLLLAIPPGYATAVWPPSGIALAALLIGGTGLWPGVALGSFAVNIATSFDASTGWAITRSVLLALTIGAGAAAQAVTGTLLIRRFVGDPLELIRERDIVKFFVLGGPVGCLVGASIGVAALWVAGLVRPNELAYSWWTWWIGDSIGVAVAAPFAFVWFGRPHDVWSRRRWSVAAPLVSVLALNIVIFMWVTALEDARVRNEFDSYAQETTASIRRTFEDTIHTMQSVAALYASTPDAERGATFSTFTRRILRDNSTIQGLSWNPRVSIEQREAFEQRARDQGYADFRITERDQSGALVPAAPRDAYIAVLHIEPEWNAPARGYDVASEPTRLVALRRACETGRPVATTGVHLVQDANDKEGLLVFLPVWQENADIDVAHRCEATRGFVTGVIRIQDIVSTSLTHPRDPNITVSALDEGALSSPMEAGGSHERERPAPSPETLVHRAHVDLAGRSWSIVYEANPRFGTALRSWRPWVTLASGMLFTGLLAAFLLVVTGQAVVTERFGAERATELTAANERLQREIVERGHAEDALRDKDVALQQAVKMEAIGRLAGGVAHDFNNLLTAILGYARLLGTGFAPTDRRSRDLQEIVKAAERAAGLTKQLLAFSRKQTMQPRVIDLNTLTTDCTGMLRRLIGEHIELVAHYTPDLARVRADAGQIEQVLVNLVVNARDALPSGGAITVGTSNIELDARSVLQHPGARPGQYAMLSVRDNGVGMDEETKRHLFEPFFTTKERDRGTGLGLATVYGIVKQSDGYIAVESELGRGAVFTILLPAVEEIVEVNRPPAPSDQSMAGAETVLVVEDEEVVRALSCRLLEQLGYRVVEAASPMQAEALFHAEPAAIDLLLTDVIMPGCTGPVLYATLAASRPDLKVLYMSGYADTGIVHGGRLDEGVTLLSKPFSAEELADSVRKVLDGR